MKISPAIRKHLTLFVIILIAVIILDQIIAIVADSILNTRPSHPGPSFSWGSAWILPDSALRGAAAFNDTLTELWFAETMTFILAPLILIWFYKRFNLKFWTPWILTGVVALIGIVANINRVYSGYWSVSPPQITEILHDGAYSPIHKNTEVDYMLESESWEFLSAQVLFIVPFSLGFLATDKINQAARV